MVYISDNFGTSYDLIRGHDFPGDPTRPPLVDNSANINFPSNFKVDVSTYDNNALKVEMTVTLKKLAQPTNVTQATTNVNMQPSVIYLKDFTPGYYYTFTSRSPSSKIAILMDAHFVTYATSERTSLSNIFVTDGIRKLTAYPFLPHMYVSQSNQVTICLAAPISLLGAILVTDYENVKGFYSYEVQYVPVGSEDNTSFAMLQGGNSAKTASGAVTIIGDKNGATPITVRQLLDYSEGGQFSYVSGGPVVNYSVVASPLSNRNLPKTLSGTMNTFMITQGTGNVKYSI